MEGLTKEERQEAIKECFINDCTPEEMKSVHGTRWAIAIVTLVLGVWICASIGLRVPGIGM